MYESLIQALWKSYDKIIVCMCIIGLVIPHITYSVFYYT